MTNRIATIGFVIFASTTAIFGQTPSAAYRNDFQSYVLHTEAEGWVDSVEGGAGSRSARVFSIWPDPVQGDGAANLVYGARPDGVSPGHADPRLGRFSTYTGLTFDGSGHFQYRGRFLRSSSRSQIGLVFFSSPERLAAYVIGVRQQPLGAMTIQLFAIGGGSPQGTLDSNFSPDANHWYDFLIEATDTGFETRIQARFWIHGTAEPDTFSIVASDRVATRQTRGRIGVWVGGLGGAAYVDDLVAATSAVDQSTTSITFLDASTHVPLDPEKLALFKGAGSVAFRVTGDLSQSLLDDAPFNPGSPVRQTDGSNLYTPAAITVDGRHTWELRAGDRQSTLRFLVDQHPPVVALSANRSPLDDGAIFDANIAISADVSDISDTTRIFSIDSVVTSLPASVSAEAKHRTAITVVDQVGWSTTVERTFILDKSPPVVTITANGTPLAPGARFNAPVTVGWTVEDLTLDPAQVSATLDGAPVTSGALISADAVHNILVVATDRAHHTTSITGSFAIDRTAPTAILYANGNAFTDGMSFNAPVVFTVQADSGARIDATVDGEPYTPGRPVADEKRDHGIKVVVTSATGATVTLGPYRFAIDLTRPVIALTIGGQPFVEGMLFNHDVLPVVTVTDNFTATPRQTLAIDGHDFPIGTPVIEEGLDHSIRVTATDDAGNIASLGPFHFGIDKTPPVITFISPQPNSVVAPSTVTVQGVADDALTLTVNDRPTAINGDRTFAAAGVTLLEGRNEIVATGTDKAGNVGTSSLVVNLDTRAPELTIASPLVNACLKATQINVEGHVLDPHKEAVRVSVSSSPASPVAAVIAPDGSWTATVAAPSEGRYTIVAEASDSVGHVTKVTLPLTVDTTPPVLQVSESGGLINHPTSIAFRVSDTDPTVVASATLNGQPYASGVLIASDGDYRFSISAHDCAGNVSDARTIVFTIDTKAPSIVSVSPENGAKAGSAQQTIAGTLDADDVVSVVMSGTPLLATISGRTFTFGAVPLIEGTNRFTMIVTDRAGNSSSLAYALTAKSAIPIVEIQLQGQPIPEGAFFNGPVAPVVTVNEGTAVVSATLNGNAFSSGTTISADGHYSLKASASDAFGHMSAEAAATFTIDATAPVLRITAPPNAAVVHADHVEVRGTVGGDEITRVTVAGIVATLSPDGTFSVIVPLEPGPNVITATAIDRAGNSGGDVVNVSGDEGRPGIILTLPADHIVTNRIVTPVIGQVLTPQLAGNVTINGNPIATDSAGVFRKQDLALIEGDNAITAVVTSKGGTTNSVTVHVLADFTPPLLRVLANGSELSPGARFPTAPTILLDAHDSAGSTAISLVVDGVEVNAPFTPASNGGHSLLAIARDLAGNETRLDRTFSIGEAALEGGCPPTSLDPANRTSVFADHVMLAGRAGAGSVLVGGAVVPVVDGAFATSVPLSVEGANLVSIGCADASGHALGTPSTLTLFRFTSAPSVTIASPSEGAEVTEEGTQVSLTVGAGVLSGDVNGVSFTVAGDPGVVHSVTVDNVPIANGLNIITARVLNSAGRTGFASVRVRRYGGQPQLVITSPLPLTATGAASIAVGGAYANLDPATVTVSAGSVSYPVQLRQASDTTGTFIAAAVPLVTAQTTTITATGRNRASGATATTSVDVRNIPGAPSIVISSPADNEYFRSDAPRPVVAGSFVAGSAATTQVNGGIVTPVGGTFTTTVDFASGASGVTPIVARVANVDGTSASAAIRIVRMAAPLAVTDTFPSSQATDAGPGVLLVVLFNNPIDRSSIQPGGLRLTDSSGAEITGTAFVDRESLSFAPRIPLAPGTNYTFTIAQSVKDVAGGSLSSLYELRFATSSSGPTVAPLITPTDVSGCLSTYTIRGTSSSPGARLQLSIDGVIQPATAANDRSFAISIDLSPGTHIGRVREIGPDGTLSPPTEVTIHVSCAALQVLSAALDRVAKTVTIRFSRPMNITSLDASPSGTILISPDGQSTITGTVALNPSGDVATVSTSSDLSSPIIRLVVKKSVQDQSGGSLAGDFTQVFTTDGDLLLEPGKGYVSGGVYDATTGRPLANAIVAIHVPLNAFTLPNPRTARSLALVPSSDDAGNAVTTASGRYLRTLAEGAYTIEVSAAGFTTAWRQVVVRPGAGVVPIDIRLTRRGPEQLVDSGPTSIAAAADSTLARAAELTIPAAAALAQRMVALTPVGAQSLAGLLPLGWSPLAAVEIAVDGNSKPAAMAGAQLTFVLTSSDVAGILAGAQTLSLVEYDSDRDEWRVVVASVLPAENNRLTFAIARSGHYALVYPDNGSGVVRPRVPGAGAALPGVVAPCAPCAIISRTFALDPVTILPNGSTIATLLAAPAPGYPSGTAVQAYIDETLNLADGRVLLDPPFTTDLLLYRSLTNDAGVAVFHLAPTPAAAAETLRDGVDHIRIVDYPGRIDRGALIGPEGGRVSGDGAVVIEIPSGAATEPIHATTTSLTAGELAAIGGIPGFHLAAGFTLSIEEGSGAVVSLLKPARATFTVDATQFAGPNRQVVVAELLSNTSYGFIVRLAAITSVVSGPAPGISIVTTRSVSTAELPLDGIVRSGRYLVLTADSPLAYAWGQVRAGDRSGPTIPDSRVISGIGNPLTSPLGIADLTRSGGVFVIPVLAAPSQPFSLLARSISAGDGDAVVSSSAPAADAFVPIGSLPLLAPPLASPVITPADGAIVNPDAPFNPHAEFNTTIDSTSVANALTIVNLTNGRALQGTTTAAGLTVSFHPTERLDAGASYVLNVSPAIRSSSGRLFGRTAVAHFSTAAVPPGNTSIHPERIRITIPDSRGVSVISGVSGALPAGDQALAARRGIAFVGAPQATVANDGSFQFSAGDGTTDIVTTSDSIDLQVIDSVSHAIVAVIPLTPFIASDGRGFIAPPGVATTFTASAPLSVTVTVPAGAFTTSTLVHLSPADQSEVAGVPGLATELHVSGLIHIDFDGVAQEPLQVSLAAPSDATTSRAYYLGFLGHSTRGPRFEVVDTVRLDGTNFTTALASTAAPLRASLLAVRGQSALVTPSDVKKLLGGVTRPAAYAVIDLTPSIGWGVISGAAEGSELFWDSIQSLFVSSYTLSRNVGRALVPVAANKPFSVVGVDASTGLQMFAKVYAGFPPGDPLGAIVLDPSSDSGAGPLPVFASMARLEVIDVPPAGVSLTSPGNLTVTALENGSVTVVDGAGAHVEVFNPDHATFNKGEGSATIAATRGDRVLATVAASDVDPEMPVSISFNKRMYVGAGSDDVSVTNYLKGLITVTTDDGQQGSQPTDITPQVTFSVDSDAHRIRLKFGGSLQLGKRYAVVLSRNLSDASGDGNSPGMKLGESKRNNQTSGGLPASIRLTFTVRKPAGRIATTSLLAGSVIHDMALNGNLALVAAGNGGLQAYDVSDPAKLDGAEPPLSAFIDCNWDAGSASFDPCSFGFWSVASDRHGRIVATGMSGALGSLRTFRINDFINPSSQQVPPLPRYVPLEKQVGGTPISWTPGINALMPIGSELLLGDKPEAIPRRVQMLVQDDEVKLTRASLLAKYQGSASPLADGYQKLTLQIAADNPSYHWQAVTVENRTLKLHWSVDVPKNATRQLGGIIAGPADELYVVVNRATYAVVSLFGFGVGVYDVNAIESNDRPIDADYRKAGEIVALTKGNDGDGDPSTVVQCDQAAILPIPCPINDLTFSPDALLRTDSGSSAIQLFALEQHRGIFDVVVTPPDADSQDGGKPAHVGSTVGLSLTSPYLAADHWDSFDQPRLRTLRKMYKQTGGIDAKDVRPVGRHANIAYYARPPAAGSLVTAPDEYALIASFEYGVIVVKLGDAPLNWCSVVDVIWIPAGAMSVRVMPRGDMAVVVDGAGRVLLVDLRQIDESGKVAQLPSCDSDELFPTAAAALRNQSPPLSADADWIEVGIDDPRILWKSEPHLVHGTLAPLVDPDTGIVFTGDVNALTARAEINTVAATDPRVRFIVNTGAQGGYRETGGIIPLGIAPPSGLIPQVPDSSLAAFRVELWLPGSLTDALIHSNNEVRVALESERVLNVPSQQTIAPLPPSHLRRGTIDGKVDSRIAGNATLSKFKLSRLVPYDANDPEMKPLRYQTGFNHFVSPWVVAIADPRASVDYKLPEWMALSADDKAKLGCYACDRPAFLDPKKTPGLTNVYELLTTGRFISARPEVCTAGTNDCAATTSIFSGTKYAYLGAAGRLRGRVTTVMADTVRATTVLTSSDAPPIAGGALQETTFVHSGEVATAAIDLDAGGRAGWNVLAERTYRSRTMLSSSLGFGWESSLFARLRQLPNGDIEYRDGSGEVWLFLKGDSTYTPPFGMTIQLIATPSGWTLLDQKRRLTTFDSLGRVVSRSDQFFDDTGGGNAINYFYDASGRLGSVVDPVGRVSKLSYFDDCANTTADCSPGMVREIADWRGRKVTFHYDGRGNLIAVDKPEARNDGWPEFDQTGQNRPTVRYAYKAAGTSLEDFIELGSNLESIQDPAGAKPRVTFHYDDSGSRRDFVHDQVWGTDDHANATFDFATTSITSLPSSASVTDSRRQRRIYTFVGSVPGNVNADRPRLQNVTEENVVTWNGSAFGLLPDSVSKSDGDHFASANRTTTFGYENGRLKTIATAGGASITIDYENSGGGDLGRMVHRVESDGGAGSSNQVINHVSELAFVASTQADGTDVLNAPEALHGSLTTNATNAGVTTVTDFYPSGLLHSVRSTGDGVGATATMEYYDATDSDRFKRSRLRTSTAGEGSDTIKSAFDYPNADQSREQGPRGVATTTEYDEMGRPIHAKASGNDDLAPEEWFAYDRNGRLAGHRHTQGGKRIEERFEYDLVGRTTKRSILDGSSEVEATRMEYFIADRDQITTHLPGGATKTDTIDALGRLVKSEADPQNTSATKIRLTNLYDVEDNVAFTTDGHSAVAGACDSAHRARLTLSSDGTRSERTLDGWDRTRASTIKNGSQTLRRYSASYVGPQLQHVEENGRTTDYTWDGAGRVKTAVSTGAEQPRTAHFVYDTAGRLVETKAGEGDATSIVHAFNDLSYSYGTGNSELPVSAISIEDQNHTQKWSLAHDTLGQTIHAGIDQAAFNFDHHFDESGNVTSSKTPARRGETSYDYDARSFNTIERMPSSKQPNRYEPDPSGVLKKYTDPSGEFTDITSDGLGRPVLRTYPDGTTEEIHYDGERTDWTRDRQKREQHFHYYEDGRVSDVLNAAGVLLDHLDYENGRLTRWKTPDASIEFSDFDVDSHPRQITQHRLSADGSEVDSYSMTHNWNAAGELIQTGMPSYEGMSAGARWVMTLDFKHDAEGNVRTILRNGLPLMDAVFRSEGRPVTRNLTLPAGLALGRSYDYDDATGVGRLSGMRVTIGNSTVAGSELTFEGSQRKSEQLLGIAGGTRYTNWSYDDRGRVTGSIVATVDANAIPEIGLPGATTVAMSDADFRSSLDRTVVRPEDPPSTITGESPAGHKVVSITRGAAIQSIRYEGANGEVSVRTDDARYHYDFDEKEHLRAITEKLIVNGTQSRLLRIRYGYDGFGRIVSRRVETAPVSNNQPPAEHDWALATSDVVANQPLPAATTFVWDPVTDNLAAIYPEGASHTNAAPIRQFIHGGMGMDDPIEVVTPDARLFPIYDEAGAGNLQAVIGEDGHLIARGLTGDAYGEEQQTITGPTIDEVKLTAKKDTSGNLAEVRVTMHCTETLDASTIASGTRLASVAADGTLVRTSTAPPTQPDPYTVVWTLPVADWTSLIAGAKTASLSIGVTSTLRSTTYGSEVPFLPAVPTANVFSSTTLPIEVRESLAAAESQFASSGSDTPFAVSTLTNLGTPNGNVPASLIMSAFQALPFTEPITGLVNARNRWYDAGAGSWISADPIGYRDSANLYAFAGGDPVNGRDPSGLAGYFFDGTWNDQAKMKNPTNVSKLRKLYAGRAFYIPGVGTRWYSKYLGGLTGAGAQLRIYDLYDRLVEAYNRGDTAIDIFGFSRGAATAVDFANFIRERGIPDLASAYQKPVGDGATVTRYRRYFHPTVRFLGLFDVVGSFGMPGDESDPGHDLRRPSNVKVIRHATSRNERRYLFPLTSMLDAPNEGPRNVVERAFRGAHSDVGGGYDDNNELSKVPLGWMWDEARKAGVPFDYLAEEERSASMNLVEHDESGWFDRILEWIDHQDGRAVYYQRKPYDPFDYMPAK
jgi:RHS repeat-associated protein